MNVALAWLVASFSPLSAWLLTQAAELPSSLIPNLFGNILQQAIHETMNSLVTSFEDYLEECCMDPLGP